MFFKFYKFQLDSDNEPKYLHSNYAPIQTNTILLSSVTACIAHTKLQHLDWKCVTDRNQIDIKY